MGLPQLIMIIFLTINVCFHFAKHGGHAEVNVWHALFGTGLLSLLLWWGGFW